MKGLTERKNKHMTLEDRLEIQECLNRGMTFGFRTDLEIVTNKELKKIQRVTKCKRYYSFFELENALKPLYRNDFGAFGC